MEINTKILEILVDEADADLLKNNRIYLYGGYACFSHQKLHRIILSRKIGRAIKVGMVVDHINRNKLDNRRENLREVSILDNNLNKDLKHRKCFGSTYLPKTQKWQAQIKIDGKKIYLGTFSTEEEAQECYLKKKKELGK